MLVVLLYNPELSWSLLLFDSVVKYFLPTTTTHPGSLSTLYRIRIFAFVKLLNSLTFSCGLPPSHRMPAIVLSPLRGADNVLPLAAVSQYIVFHFAIPNVLLNFPTLV